MAAPANPATPPPEPVALRFEPDGFVPNNRDLPVMLVPGALPGATAEEVKALYAKHNWDGAWVSSIFEREHYHTRSHEVLACVSGRATIRLGGPHGRDVTLSAGDVAVLPAGTGHCLLREEEGFAVVGGYPAGQEDYDLVWADEPPPEDATASIKGVPLPVSDPIWGADGPLTRLWPG